MENRTTVEPLARKTGKGAKSALIVAAGAFCLGTVFLALTLVLASCSASVSSAINPNGGARISVEAEVPATLATKIRKLESAGGRSPSSAQSPVFDAQAIRKALAARPGTDVIEISQPKPEAIRILLSVRSLKDLAAVPEIQGSGLLTIERGSTSTEFRFHLERGDAKALSTILPGIDSGLMDAFSPPALEEDPLSLEEYKTMIRSVLGEQAMLAMEAASIKLSVSAPGPVLSSSGGTLSGSTLTASIPILEILALEKPIELRLRWKNAE
jgi:hypothetical protein